MTIKQLNTFLQSRPPSLSRGGPLFVFITGASGAGKTHLAQALTQELDPKFVHIAYFYRIGVPPAEEMIKDYGSGEKWQEAMTHQWVKRLTEVQDKTVIILEGQFNPQFAVDTCKKLGIQYYILVLLHADRAIREHRLIKYRLQPELANETMENWTRFLKFKTEELGGIIIHTSGSNLQANLNEVAALIEKKLRYRISTYEIRSLQQNDIPLLVSAFKEIGWNKPASLYEKYVEEQDKQQRGVWVAFKDGLFLGYVTLKWYSEYAPFKQQGIPEISDLNVLPQFRQQGIGSKLLDWAEAEAHKKSPVVGTAAGLTADYGDAQRLYVRRGYRPDRLGVTSHYHPVSWGELVRADDDLILWFRKELS